MAERAEKEEAGLTGKVGRGEERGYGFEIRNSYI